ncbi:f-box domain [Lecanosticta acicola]|uniref:F-box domain n=1 Tax=Lecanosticta acicola TaxID=111012 RepID=A0AAI8YYD4_9PEZI|nr:f-box domain [Lecanosticta acicola]
MAHAPESTLDPSTPPPSAAVRVFKITELLEGILLELPMHRLFIVQQTCKVFHDTIRDSTRLQRHMFLTAEPAPPNPETCARVFNPVLMGTLFSPDVSTKASMISKHGFFLLRNPRSTNFAFTIYSEASQRDLSLWQRKGDKPQLPLYDDITEPWRRMVPVQPAITALTVGLAHRFSGATFSQSPYDYSSLYDLEILREESLGREITLGDVYDLAEGLYKKYCIIKYGKGGKF